MQSARFLSFFSFVILIGLALFGGCGEDPAGPPPVVIPADGEAILYSKHIQPIFENSCAGADCHIGGEGGGLALDNWDRLTEGSDFGAVVLPFSAAHSHMFQHINTDSTLGPIRTPRMPLSRDPLPIEQIGTIMRWIDEGAKNDAGEIPLAGETRPRVLVTCQSEDKVWVVDLATELAARFVQVGSRPDETSPPEAPHNIALSPDKRYFYINLISAGMVEKYDARTFEKAGETQVGLSPAEIVLTADGSTMYVSNFDMTFQQEFINRIDPVSMTRLASIQVEGKAPHGVTLSRDERYLYTMNAGSDDISKIELATDEVVQRIPIVPGTPPAPAGSAAHEPYQSVITPDGLMFVTCRKSGQVRVVDLEAGRVIDSITVGARPLIPALSPDGTELWVPNQGSNTVSIINTGTRKVVATIYSLAAQPHGIRFTADGARAFVSCENQTGDGNLHHPPQGAEVVPGLLYVVNAGNRQITGAIETGGFAAGIAILE